MLHLRSQWVECYWQMLPHWDGHQLELRHRRCGRGLVVCTVRGGLRISSTYCGACRFLLVEDGGKSQEGKAAKLNP